MGAKHNKEMILIVENCVKNRNKAIRIPISLDELSKDINLIDKCIDCVLDEFCEKGLRNDSEPNEYGFKLEETIEFLNSYRYNLEE